MSYEAFHNRQTNKTLERRFASGGPNEVIYKQLDAIYKSVIDYCDIEDSSARIDSICSIIHNLMSLGFRPNILQIDWLGPVIRDIYLLSSDLTLPPEVLSLVRSFLSYYGILTETQ